MVVDILFGLLLIFLPYNMFGEINIMCLFCLFVYLFSENEYNEAVADAIVETLLEKKVNLVVLCNGDIDYELFVFSTSSVESQKGAINMQRCSVENQKGAIAVQCIWR